MIYVQFLLGLFSYVMLTVFSYSESLKTTKLYYFYGLIFAILANYTWLWISRYEPDASKLLIKGFYWDIMLTLTYAIIPLVFYGAKLTSTQSIGLVTVIVGVTLIKLGG